MGMRINTNSILYKINRVNYGSDIPKSLCPYFWASILSILVLSWLGPMVQILDKAFGNISLPKFNIGLFRFFNKQGRKIPYLISGGLAGYGAISFFVFNDIFGIWNMALGSGLMVWSKYSTSILKRTFKTTYKIPTRETQPSVFKEYVKAKHHSICPTLEFVDFEKEDFNDSVKKITRDSKAVMPEMEKIMKLAESDDVSLEATEEIINTTGKLLEKAEKHNLHPDDN